MIKKAVESLYDGKCTITELSSWADPITNITQNVEFDVVVDEPCRISYKDAVNANETDTVSNADQIVVLFIRPDLIIKDGSKITVTQCSRTVQYKASGKPRVYNSHQEITLEILDDKA